MNLLKNNKTFFIFSIVILIFSFAYLPNAYSQQVQQAQKKDSGAQNLVGGYGETYQIPPPSKAPHAPYKYLFYPSPSSFENFVTNAIYNSFFKYMGNNSGLLAYNLDALKKTNSPKTLTGQALFNLLTATDNTVQTAISSGVKIPAPLTSGNVVYRTVGGVTIPEQSKLPPFTASLNLESLVGPLQYSSQVDKNTTLSTQQAAENFIKLLSGQAAPSPGIDFSQIKPEDLRSALQNPLAQQYLIQKRAQIANIGVGINNLYSLYAERFPIPYGKDISVPSNVKLPSWMTKTGNVSVLALDQFMATRRLMRNKDDSKNDWSTQMEKATPATLQREMVYLLAEIRYELFQNRMVNERILATLSAMQVQATANNQLTTIAATERTLCTQEPFSGSGACPSSVAQAAAALKQQMGR